MKGYKVKQVQFYKGQQIGGDVKSCYPHKPDVKSIYDMTYHPACGVFFEPLPGNDRINSTPFLISQAVIERITFEKVKA